MIVGAATFRSRPFSDAWELSQDSGPVAVLRRIPSRHTSEIVFTDRARLTLAPEGWGTVVARTEDGEERARIVRRSWWGRTWEVEAAGFGCQLISDPLPRRWSLRMGSEPIGRLAGGLVSYNRIDVQADVAVPVSALALAWHVIARPWEQAAAPGALVARPSPDTGGEQ